MLEWLKSLVSPGQKIRPQRYATNTRRRVASAGILLSAVLGTLGLVPSWAFTPRMDWSESGKTTYREYDATIYQHRDTNALFIKLPPNVDALIDDKRIDQSGLYNHDWRIRYTFEHYDDLLTLSKDGEVFVAYRSGTDNDLKRPDSNTTRRPEWRAYLNFYHRGQLIAQYHLTDLVEDTRKIQKSEFDSVNYWINDWAHDHSKGILYIETVDGHRYSFQLATGRILTASRKPFKSLTLAQRLFFLFRWSKSPWVARKVSGSNIVQYEMLMDAIRAGDVKLVKDTLSRGANPARIVSSTRYGVPNVETTLVHVATIEDQLDIVRTLVEAGADIHARDGRGETALQVAIANGKKQIAQYLLTKGAE